MLHKKIRKSVFCVFGVVCVAAVSACSSSDSSRTDAINEKADLVKEKTVSAGEDEKEQKNESSRDSAQNILIVYFTAGENSDVDAVSSASVTTVDGQVKGRLRALADMIRKYTGGDLFSIETCTQG